MDISAIIGPGKAFEPPFYEDPDGMYIFDNNDHMVLEIRGNGHLQCLFNLDRLYDEVYPAIASHICKLLNERWNNPNPSKSSGLN